MSQHQDFQNIEDNVLLFMSHFKSVLIDLYQNDDNDDAAQEDLTILQNLVKICLSPNANNSHEQALNRAGEYGKRIEDKTRKEKFKTLLALFQNMYEVQNYSLTLLDNMKNNKAIKTGKKTLLSSLNENKNSITELLTQLQINEDASKLIKDFIERVNTACESYNKSPVSQLYKDIESGIRSPKSSPKSSPNSSPKIDRKAVEVKPTDMQKITTVQQNMAVEVQFLYQQMLQSFVENKVLSEKSKGFYNDISLELADILKQFSIAEQGVDVVKKKLKMLNASIEDLKKEKNIQFGFSRDITGETSDEKKLDKNIENFEIEKTTLEKVSERFKQDMGRLNVEFNKCASKLTEQIEDANSKILNIQTKLELKISTPQALAKHLQDNKISEQHKQKYNDLINLLYLKVFLDLTKQIVDTYQFLKDYPIKMQAAISDGMQSKARDIETGLNFLKSQVSQTIETAQNKRNEGITSASVQHIDSVRNSANALITKMGAKYNSQKDVLSKEADFIAALNSYTDSKSNIKTNREKWHKNLKSMSLNDIQENTKQIAKYKASKENLQKINLENKKSTMADVFDNGSHDTQFLDTANASYHNAVRQTEIEYQKTLSSYEKDLQANAISQVASEVHLPLQTRFAEIIEPVDSLRHHLGQSFKDAESLKIASSTLTETPRDLARPIDAFISGQDSKQSGSEKTRGVSDVLNDLNRVHGDVGKQFAATKATMDKNIQEKNTQLGNEVVSLKKKIHAEIHPISQLPDQFQNEREKINTLANNLEENNRTINEVVGKIQACQNDLNENALEFEYPHVESRGFFASKPRSKRVNIEGELNDQEKALRGLADKATTLQQNLLTVIDFGLKSLDALKDFRCEDVFSNRDRAKKLNDRLEKLKERMEKIYEQLNKLFSSNLGDKNHLRKLSYLQIENKIKEIQKLEKEMKKVGTQIVSLENDAYAVQHQYDVKTWKRLHGNMNNMATASDKDRLAFLKIEFERYEDRLTNSIFGWSNDMTEKKVKIVNDARKIISSFPIPNEKNQKPDYADHRKTQLEAVKKHLGLDNVEVVEKIGAAKTPESLSAAVSNSENVNLKSLAYQNDNWFVKSLKDIACAVLPKFMFTNYLKKVKGRELLQSTAAALPRQPKVK